MLALEIGDTYGYLLGDWRIERTFSDHWLRETGVLHGTVTVVPDRSGDRPTAYYDEVGELRIGSYRGTAHRRLRFVRQLGGAVTVTFEDGRRFVACDLRAGSCDATHLCGDDRYEISWDVHSRDAVSERWRVRGPCKDYEASAVLHRLPG